MAEDTGMAVPDGVNGDVYVDRFYEMDPEFDDLIFGRDLREGMVVLLEDRMLRSDPDRLHDNWERAKCRAVNRWAEVTALTVVPRRPEVGSPLIRFIALYADGTKAVRTYDASYAWIVKKASVGA